MKRFDLLLFVTLFTVGGFGGGYWFAHLRGGTPKPPERRILYWVDPMHPAYTSDRPGVAPDCGMDLVPVYEDPWPAAGSDALHRLPSGTIQITPEKQQLTGIEFATAEQVAATETIRAVGKVAIDETRIVRVHPRIDGWVSRTFGDFTGQRINQGDPLITLYSPELLAAQKEYLLALKAIETMRGSSSPDAVEASQTLAAAARRRLDLMQLDPRRIEDLERTRTAERDVTIYSPVAGFVTSRGVFPGQKVSPETELYAISDLSRVWIMADVFEADTAKIVIGQSALVTPAGTPGRAFTARVDYIQPQVDPATRTMKVRLEAPNQDTHLKPEMFVNVEFHRGLPSQVVIPANAVINTGMRKTVYVDLGDGRLEPRIVETGDPVGDRIQIIRGLRAGERVASSGAFLVDSEAQMRGASPAAAGSAPAGSGPTGSPAAGNTSPPPALGGHRHD